MAKKPYRVYLSPSNQPRNMCRLGHSEKQHCEELVELMKPYLEKYGIEYKVHTPGLSLSQWVREAEAWGATLYLPIHTNAASQKARGTRFGFYPGRRDSSNACNIFVKHWKKLYPIPDNVRSTTYTFLEAREPKVPSVYVELIFHDNMSDAVWFHANMDAAAANLVDAIADFYGIYQASPPKSITDGHIVKMAIKRSENAGHFNVPINTVIELPIEEYLLGVVPAEVGNAPLEACKAQAIAARSMAYYWTRGGQTITDTAAHQVYRANRAISKLYPNAHHGVKETAGQVLMYNGAVAQTYYAHSNGGRVIAAHEHWVANIPYLVTKDDPWTKATGEPLNGHPVGMSQVGAIYAASNGVKHQEILAFYYPGTVIEPKAVQKPPTPVTPTQPGTAPKPVSPPLIPEKYLYKAKVITRQPFSLNLWSSVSKYRSLGKARRGDEVYVLDIINDGWVRAQYGRTIGYIDRKYILEPKREDVLYRAEVKTIFPLSLNIWRDARKGLSLAKVPRGALIDVLEEVNQDFARVRYGRHTGYSQMKYLKKVDN